MQRRLIHLAAFLGQRKTRASALAQAQAQALLEVAHLLADGRTADTQHVLGGRKAAALHHAAVDFQQADIEIADLGQGLWTFHAMPLHWRGVKAHNIPSSDILAPATGLNEQGRGEVQHDHPQQVMRQDEYHIQPAAEGDDGDGLDGAGHVRQP
ncbi:hypothetical protein D3C81_684690 [compost metagenome]